LGFKCDFQENVRRSRRMRPKYDFEMPSGLHFFRAGLFEP
jgi:hypothetical protein